MSRQQYPPISSYQTPQSNMAASIHSRELDAQGRLSCAFPPLSQSVYYVQPYPEPQVPQYAQHPQANSHYQPMTSAPVQMCHQQPQHQISIQQTPRLVQSQPSMMDSKPSLQPSTGRSHSVNPPTLGTPHAPSGSATANMATGSAGSDPNSNAVPGPIPATTPIVVRQDQRGIQWIAFEYSRDRVKIKYTIRCDVKSVNIDELSAEFKQANCVYPRACYQTDQYKGNRLHYESECNALGWALAQLNPNLRGKRGLVQRAVDSWRNSNPDPRLRSRRVRRQAKIQTRKVNIAQCG